MIGKRITVIREVVCYLTVHLLGDEHIRRLLIGVAMTKRRHESESIEIIVIENDCSSIGSGSCLKVFVCFVSV